MGTDYEKALSWLERNLPRGHEIVAAAMAQLRPQRCPALQELIHNEEIVWDVPGRFVKYTLLDPDGKGRSGSLIFDLRSQWKKIKDGIGADGYRRLIQTGTAEMSHRGERLRISCFLREQAGALSDELPPDDGEPRP
jgi:hypothetical protein